MSGLTDTLNRDSVLRQFQDLFVSGLVVIVGSGASCARGLPSMQKLASLLVEDSPTILSRLPKDDKQAWSRVLETLTSGVGLEAAIGREPLPDSVVEALSEFVTTTVETSEAPALADILMSETRTDLGRLLEHALRATTVLDVVTTNYDRLIEAHAARAGIGVDTMMAGQMLRVIDQKRSSDEHRVLRGVTGKPSKMAVANRPHIRLAKPHGSLGWYLHGGQIVATDLPVKKAPRVVAPGENKYRLGYELPFDTQRERANKAIDQATAFLVIGYGFNDDHLQTHLSQAFPNTPSVIMAHTLTDRARDFLDSSSQALGLERGDNDSSTVAINNGNEVTLPGNLWAMEGLIKEALGL